MKKIYIFIILLIFICNSLFAQNTMRSDTLRKLPFWSISMLGGLVLPFGDFSNNYNTSIDAGMDISYHPIRHWAFFFNSHYTFLLAKDVNYTGNAGYLELGVGARVYLGKAHEIFFVEAGVGDYIYHFTSPISNTPATTKGNIGVKAGIGGNMPVSDKILLLIKTDMHLVFTTGSKTYYTGLYGGVRFIL